MSDTWEIVGKLIKAVGEDDHWVAEIAPWNPSARAYAERLVSAANTAEALMLGTCDWGDCMELAVATRYQHEDATYALPVCVRHTEEYAIIERHITELEAEVNRLLEESESYRGQAEYERQARIAAADFSRNRHGYIPCECCGLDCGMDAMVPDDVWQAISPVPECPEAGVLCLWCMDELAAEKGFSKVPVRLYFPGNALISVSYSEVPAPRYQFDDALMEEATDGS